MARQGSLSIRLSPSLDNGPALPPIFHDLKEGEPPLVIGRAVDCAPPDPNPHKIEFNSKVLSRKHAEIWAERGKIFIRDTKSSFGTLLNGVRLSEGKEESPPFELRDGDEVQFSKNAEEHSQDDHKCIMIKLGIL
ncbi:SMAD/FHA domain-containing protein [Crepidotus variabilis]|uniref:SMAD/FHA domain-containing protein n=1 Tax=Crepidotus variabilis TaxID=179855 RepID=A0A9P6EJZ2_9AGAR|nr:SMAD/FHA domain-containing protein [Crepidotus variabilis]